MVFTGVVPAKVIVSSGEAVGLFNAYAGALRICHDKFTKTEGGFILIFRV